MPVKILRIQMLFVCIKGKIPELSYLFFRIGVSLGRRSLIGGVIFVIPITLTIALSAPKIDPSTSGYSSPKYSYNTTW